VAVLHNLRTTLEMIKWEHSIFALPFALCGAMLAAGGWPTAWQLSWIIVAMVAARSAAMAFNRLADAEIDAINPRTQRRALPAGALSRGFVGAFVTVACAVFVLAASQLNRLTLLLSPVALAIVLLYSYTKRFTRWSHLVLGFALGVAPAAAWIAVRGSLDPRILLLTAAVTFWVGGFDCAGAQFSVGRAGAGRRGRSGAVASLRAFPGLTRRPQPAERCFFHHERRHLGGVLPVRGGRSALAAVMAEQLSGRRECVSSLPRTCR
jgi:hypothetical protein